MCGRFALYSPYPKLASKAGAVVVDRNPAPRYNVPPGTWVPAIRRSDPEHPPVIEDLWWGYTPGWIKGKARQVINARAETVGTSGFFKSSFEKRRCLIPADGWYEWDKATTPKQPHYFCRADREPLFFGGVYAERPDGSLGCAIIPRLMYSIAYEACHRSLTNLDNLGYVPRFA